MFGKTYEQRIETIEEEAASINDGIQRDIAGLVEQIGRLNNAGERLGRIVKGTNGKG